MKKLFFKAFFVALACFTPVLAMAQPGVHINIPIPLPPPIIFPAPPEVVIVPGTDVYVVPDVEDEIFFYGGWWWRPWQGQWYRSRYYDRGWGYYRGNPSFHRHFYRGWRDDFRQHRWRGQRWEHRRVQYGDLHRNWRDWERTRYWHRPPQPRPYRDNLHRQGPGYPPPPAIQGQGHHPGDGPGPGMHRGYPGKEKPRQDRYRGRPGDDRPGR
jgi:hypothetical protein